MKNINFPLFFRYYYVMGFGSCILYIGILGVIAYPVGRIISKLDPDPESFLFREQKWELGGKIYEKLNIKYWQAKIPDVSQVLKRWMPQKRLKVGFTAETVRTMIRETARTICSCTTTCFAGKSAFYHRAAIQPPPSQSPAQSS